MKKIALVASLAIFFGQAIFCQYYLSNTYLGHRTKNELIAQFNLPIFKNGVQLYKINYSTTDVGGNASVASGLIAVPDDPAQIYPLLCYQHGTASNDTDVPSALSYESDLVIAFAGMGYVAAAPDYLGLGDSPGFHPYVHAETEASVALDMLRAAKEFAEEKSVYLNEQLFITGYSQGGHAAMALHRKLETEPLGGFSVTAAAPMSGPYSISEVMWNLILSEEVYLYPAYVPNTILSYQLMYGNLYTELEEVFHPDYLDLIEKFVNEEIDLAGLNSSLTSLLMMNEGACIPLKMLNPEIVDAVANEPNHPFNLALQANDVYHWAPVAPTRLFYCTADDQVPFENSLLADSVMNAIGAADVQAVDVDPSANHVDCVEPSALHTILFFGNFQEIQDSVAATVNPENMLCEVFPNPAEDVVFVNNLPAGGDLQILDINGKECLARKLNPGDNEVPLSHLPYGVYFLKITAGEKAWAGKLLIKK